MTTKSVFRAGALLFAAVLSCAVPVEAASTTCLQPSHTWVGSTASPIPAGTIIYPTGVVRRNTLAEFYFVPQAGGQVYVHTTNPSRDNCVIHHEPEARSTAGWAIGVYDIYAAYIEWETDGLVVKHIGWLDLRQPTGGDGGGGDPGDPCSFLSGTGDLMIDDCNPYSN